MPTMTFQRHSAVTVRVLVAGRRIGSLRAGSTASWYFERARGVNPSRAELDLVVAETIRRHGKFA